MKSGLEDRNNPSETANDMMLAIIVSMKSGLEDRNNSMTWPESAQITPSLNEVRPGRPEQCESSR